MRFLPNFFGGGFIGVIWDNTPLFVKYNPGLLDLLVLLDETGLLTGL